MREGIEKLRKTWADKVSYLTEFSFCTASKKLTFAHRFKVQATDRPGEKMPGTFRFDYISRLRPELVKADEFHLCVRLIRDIAEHGRVRWYYVRGKGPFVNTRYSLR